MFRGANYSVIELFAGAGGLALGLELAGFSTKCLVEIDEWAVKTLKHNRPKWNVIKDDIRNISNIGIKKILKNNVEIDLLSGGYPCQSFSYAGNRLGINDVRGTLFFDFAKILDEIKPKMFLAENVRGLVSHDKGRTLSIMLNVFEDIGYDVSYKMMNALDYGVAQKRERIIIVGVRTDVKSVVDEDFEYPAPYKHRLVLKDVLHNVPASPCMSYPSRKKEIFKRVKPGGCWRDLPDHLAREYMKGSYYLGGGKTGIARRMKWDEPALTVLCNPMQNQTDRCHPDDIRPFSVRENARIQSFPDDWEFMGTISQQYKQIGNAVPVNMAKEVGECIKKYLDKYFKKIMCVSDNSDKESSLYKVLF
ncbi:DNA cytosine methyltransferase [Bartonella sp. CB175]|uniref:DNA cytosine methyltransferase n=1 Tax=Bartonella sp. CB175 TaxID=3112256 RepID=UPI00300E418C